jgi:Domain of unknown function (DUF3786)/Putative Fe-S cluster
MPEIKNTMDIFKLLDKSNCKKCNKPTCLAFAAAVFQGQKNLDDCPQLDKGVIERYGGGVAKQTTIEQDLDQAVAQLKKQISSIDLDAAARRLGANFNKAQLTVKIFGKDFSVDSKGNLASDIHINPWVTIPVLNYILKGGNVPVSGKWLPFRELQSGKTWYRLFGQRCEKPLKRLADTYTDLFEDLITIFDGKPVSRHYKSDISLVLLPLPKVPILICYWKPEDGLQSDLNLFFDSAVEENLDMESLWALCTGITTMFEKIALRHGTV